MKTTRAIIICAFIAAASFAACTGKQGENTEEKKEVVVTPKSTAVEGALNAHVQVADGSYKLEMIEKRGDRWGIRPEIKVKLKFLKSFEPDSNSTAKMSAALFSEDGKQIQRENKDFGIDEAAFTIDDEQLEDFNKMLKDGKGEKEFIFTNNVTYNGTDSAFVAATKNASKILVKSELKQ